MKREVPRKNYLILTGIIIVTFILLYYFYMWYLTYEESKLNSPIMNRYLQVIKYNELDNYVLDNFYVEFLFSYNHSSHFLFYQLLALFTINFI